MRNAASYGSTWIYMICVGLRSIVKLGQRAVKCVKLTIVAITFPMFPLYSDGSRGPVLILHRNVIQKTAQHLRLSEVGASKIKASQSNQHLLVQTSPIPELRLGDLFMSHFQ